MCGIVAYVGQGFAFSMIQQGLKHLEYRGYDSAGIAVMHNQCMYIDRKVKQQDGFEAIDALHCSDTSIQSGASIGVGHTRWATHGVPNVQNTHPHVSFDSNVLVVHNGQIENHKELKREVLSSSAFQGHSFSSDTDTEVIAHMVALALLKTRNFIEAFQQVIARLRGTFGLVVMFRNEGVLLAANMGSSMAIGVLPERKGFLVVSDPVAAIDHTKLFSFLDHGVMAIVSPVEYELRSFENVQLASTEVAVNLSVEDIQKGSFATFMEKEIHEQAESLENTLRGRIHPTTGNVQLGGLLPYGEKLKAANRVVLLACGTAYYAALYGKYVLEELAGIPTDVEHAHEFAYRASAMSNDTVVFAVSQSGETADTLLAVRAAKARGAEVFGIVNRVGSTLARTCEKGVYTLAGFEKSVASTKVYTAQMAALLLLALHMGKLRGVLSDERAQDIAKALHGIPTQLFDALARELPQIEAKHLLEQVIAWEKQQGISLQHLYIIGRKYSYPVALEAALKVKEVSYIHAEAFAAGELKHGPLAMIEPQSMVISIAPQDSVAQKMEQAVSQIQSRGGNVMSFSIPSTAYEFLSPFFSVVPLQYFALYLAQHRGIDPDKPRNLAKSVTTE